MKKIDVKTIFMACALASQLYIFSIYDFLSPKNAIDTNASQGGKYTT
jgi:hypothetical protein